MAVLSLILGIVSIVLSLSGILGISFSGIIWGSSLTLWGAPIIGIIGLILGFLSLKSARDENGKKIAKAGLICSIAGVILSIVMFVVIFSVFSSWDVS